MAGSGVAGDCVGGQGGGKEYWDYAHDQASMSDCASKGTLELNDPTAPVAPLPKSHM